MSYLIEHIKGKTIDRIDKTEGCILWFGNTSLAIHNPLDLLLDNAIFSSGDLSAIEGHVVHDIRETDNEAILLVSGGFSIRIDLRPDVYTGPEAMVLHIAS